MVDPEAQRMCLGRNRPWHHEGRGHFPGEDCAGVPRAEIPALRWAARDTAPVDRAHGRTGSGEGPITFPGGDLLALLRREGAIGFLLGNFRALESGEDPSDAEV